MALLSAGIAEHMLVYRVSTADGARNLFLCQSAWDPLDTRAPAARGDGPEQEANCLDCFRLHGVVPQHKYVLLYLHFPYYEGVQHTKWSRLPSSLSVQ
jgi:hypothetical protein